MDERLRRFERDARAGDPILAARVLRERVRFGTLTGERLDLLAHLGDEAARTALALPPAPPLVSPEEAVAWWRALARFGRETGVRAALALARPVLRMSVWSRDRFAGVAEQPWRAAEALDAWVAEPTAERLEAARAAITAAYDAPDAAGGVAILTTVLGLFTAEPLDEALGQFGESVFHSRFTMDRVLALVRGELVPWALGERDPVKTREREEGRHFGADADISRSVSFSRDGRFVLSTTRQGTVTVRDSSTGAIVRDFPRIRGEVFSAAFSPDGARVFAAGNWEPCRLLDITTGEVLRSIPRGEGIHDVAFVDDRRVLTAGSDHTLRLWDLTTGAEIRVFEGHDRSVGRVVVAPGGRALTSCGQTVRVWDLESGACVASFEQSASVDTLAVAPDGEQVLVGLSDGRVRLLSLESGVEARAFQTEGGSVYGLAFLPDGTRFVTVAGSRGSQILLWDVATATIARTWDWLHSITFHVAVAPDGSRFVTGDREGGLRVYAL